MKTLGIIFSVLFFCVTIVNGQEQEVYKIDRNSSKIEWTGYGAIGGYSLSGSLEIYEGFFLKSENGNLKNGEVVFNMKSITHENKKLVSHLKGEDFFEVKKYPLAKFQIDSITATVMSGKLSIKGTAKQISVPYNITLENGVRKIKGKMAIDRTEFGINYNSESFFKNLGSNAIKDNFDVLFTIFLKE